MDFSGRSIEILSKTNDGDDLDPKDLYLVQCAVNGSLNEYGRQLFEELYQKCLSGYQRPWFHDIEHMTIDQEGYIYYKNQEVEHYDRRYAWSEDAKLSALEVKRRCEILESQGVPVNTTNVIWNWDRKPACIS